jgi:hypothetical protein
MSRVALVPALVAIVALGCGARCGYSADTAQPEPPDKNTKSPAKQSRLTVEDVERERQDSWKKPRLPPPDEIDSIIAEAYGNPLPVEDVRPFVVPKKYHDKLLKYFRKAELDKSPWTDDELGTIRIRFVGGRSMRICWFWAGQGNRLSFSYYGMRCMATGKRFAKDETLEVDAFVRRINRIEVFHEDGNSEPMWFPTPKPVAEGDKK